MHVKKFAIWVVATLLIVGMLAALTGCGGGATTTVANIRTARATPMKIALLLPETKTARYETQDKPLFEAKVKELAPDAEILYSNANQDAAAAAVAGRGGADQRRERAGARPGRLGVGGLDRHEGERGQRAGHQLRPSDPRTPTSTTTSRSTTSRSASSRAQALLDKLTADGNAGKTIVMINGSPTDNNATLFKAGAHSVLDGKVTIGAEYDTPDWSPDKAQTEMDQAITKLGKDGFVGVYAANDGTAGGAIAAMKAAGIDPKTRPTTGQDAELAAIQRILLGEQYMTVYKAIKLEAEAAAELAVALAKGEAVPADHDSSAR